MATAEGRSGDLANGSAAARWLGVNGMC
jgi:hypothetical protein